MNDTFTHVTTFIVETCCNCGIMFAVTGDENERLLRTHESFYCPRGHGQHYSGLSEAERLKRQLEASEQKLANAHFELMAAEKRTKRLEKRAKNGVCPCCHRQFVIVARHMKTKHPDFAI